MIDSKKRGGGGRGGRGGAQPFCPASWSKGFPELHTNAVGLVTYPRLRENIWAKCVHCFLETVVDNNNLPPQNP